MITIVVTCAQRRPAPILTARIPIRITAAMVAATTTVTTAARSSMPSREVAGQSRSPRNPSADDQNSAVNPPPAPQQIRNENCSQSMT